QSVASGRLSLPRRLLAILTIRTCAGGATTNAWRRVPSGRAARRERGAGGCRSEGVPVPAGLRVRVLPQVGVIASAAPEVGCAPAGFLDQFDASVRDAIAIMERAYSLHDGEPRTPEGVATASVADWLRLGALDELCRWFAGTGRVCVHNPTPAQPQPAWAAAY